jgi:hypothetical protein
LSSAIPLWQPGAKRVISSNTSLFLLLLATRYYSWSQNGVEQTQFKTNNVARWCPVTKPEKSFTMALRASPDLPVLRHACVARDTKESKKADELRWWILVGTQQTKTSSTNE